MDLHRKTKCFGSCLITFAILLRLGGSDFSCLPELPAADSGVLPFLIYLETGRDVRFSAYEAAFAPAHIRESPAPAPAAETLPCFGEPDAEGVEMYYGCSLRPDIPSLLTKPLTWDLTGEEPKVLILHTHTTESYTQNGENYEESSDYRTLDERYNMLSIGDAVAQALREKDIGVIHDRQLHDYPSYNGAYSHARKSLKTLLEEYPSVELVLDLHRDASGSPGKQLRTEAVADGKPSAQLMLVLGSNASGQSHPDWEENLSIALKLQLLLEQRAPGITRPVSLRAQRFNQDLCAGALLVEVGAAGNSHPEALIAARILGETIAMLAKGTQVS